MSVKLCFSLHFIPLDPNSESGSGSTDQNESGSTSLELPENVLSSRTQYARNNTLVQKNIHFDFKLSNYRMIIWMSERRVEGSLPMPARLSLHAEHNISYLLIVNKVLDAGWIAKHIFFMSNATLWIYLSFVSQPVTRET